MVRKGSRAAIGGCAKDKNARIFSASDTCSAQLEGTQVVAGQRGGLQMLQT